MSGNEKKKNKYTNDCEMSNEKEREKKNNRSMFIRTLAAAILPCNAAMEYQKVEMSYRMVERIPDEPFRLMAFRMDCNARTHTSMK